MRTFNYLNLQQEQWDNTTLSLIAAIYKEAGKQELYVQQHPAQLEKLLTIAKVQSTSSSNAIEGIHTTNTRLLQLMAEKTTPRTRSEQEIAGYRDVLNLIHTSFAYIPVTFNYILQLHQILFHYLPNAQAGKLKNVQNYISETYPDGHCAGLRTGLYLL